MRIFFWHTVLLGADAFLIDGSLECKFLAYFGTMLLTVAVAASSEGGNTAAAPYNANRSIIERCPRLYD